ncbi:TPA: single-stranded DNA-binding protein [Streptococcus suis]|nr:single-stranded DNA-binding protein [Streptococcus suis]
MKVTNKGYINFNNEYNKKTDTMMTASMSFANGKDDSGNWKNGYINVIAFRDNIQRLENSIGQLVEIEGTYHLNEYTNQQGKVIKTPQIIIDAFLNGNNSNSGNFQNGNNQGGYQSSFGNSNPMDISDDDLPF